MRLRGRTRATLLFSLLAAGFIAAPLAQQATPAPDPEAAARAALARPIDAGNIPFLIPHARYSNVAARLAGALRDKRTDVRTAAGRSIFVLGGKYYADAVTAALREERDPAAGAEMVRALLAIQGAAADQEAIAAAQRLGPQALDAVIITLAHTRPLDVLPYLVEFDRSSTLLADALLRAVAADAGRVARALDDLPAGTPIAAPGMMLTRAAAWGVPLPEAIVEAARRREAPARDTKLPVAVASTRSPDTRWTDKGIWRSLDPLPGLTSAVAAASGCRQDDYAPVVLQISYGSRGQARSVPFAPTTASPACREAAQLLGVLEVAPIAAAAPSERSDYIVTVFTPHVFECDGRSAPTAKTVATADSGILAPRKLRDVRPVYPQDLITARVQGSVVVEGTIEPSGCVAKLSVLAPAHPGFNVSALAAVAQWRYEPTLLNGVPVGVIMTTTSNFTLK